MPATPSTPSTLDDVLRDEREGVLDRALSAVRHVRGPHYEAAGDEEVRRRLDALYDHVVVAATRRNLGPLVEYARRLAAERYPCGYTLAELQAAFNALEEALWEELMEDLPTDLLADALTLVSAIFGIAKDTLACAYVEAATRTRHPALDLQSLYAGAGCA